MSNEPKRLNDTDLKIWRGYYQAAITGMLASSTGDPYTTALPDLIAEHAANFADAAIEQEKRRE